MLLNVMSFRLLSGKKSKVSMTGKFMRWIDISDDGNVICVVLQRNCNFFNLFKCANDKFSNDADIDNFNYSTVSGKNNCVISKLQ